MSNATILILIALPIASYLIGYWRCHRQFSAVVAGLEEVIDELSGCEVEGVILLREVEL